MASVSNSQESVSSSSGAHGQDQHGAAAQKTTPKDALVMASILREMGVNEYEPRVINQMLEFTYRYVTDVLDDARVYSMHASKKIIDLEDVKLAVERRLDHSFTSPPPRELLLEIARQKNSQPLPMIGDKSGLRLPPDRYCLTANNYKLKVNAALTKKVHAQKSTGKDASQSHKGGRPGSPGARGPLIAMGTPGTRLPNTTGGANISLDAVSVAQKQLPGTPEGMFSATPQGARPSSVSTISSLPSMEETTASVQQHQFPSLLKRKRDEDDEDYDT